MGAVILEKFLNQAIQAYGSEAAAVSETVATGIRSLTDPRGIAAVADASWKSNVSVKGELLEIVNRIFMFLQNPLLQ